MQRWTIPLLAVAALAVPGAASSSEAEVMTHEHYFGAEVEVMTQNQYVGTDLLALITAPDFNAAAVDALKTRAASLPAERAKALAALIARRRPALVGLQEVYRFTCLEVPSAADGKGCDNPMIAGAFTDQLADTLAALNGQYEEAATVVDLDLPGGLTLPDGSPLPIALPGIPITIDGMTIYLGVIDRDVILARKGVPHRTVPYTAMCPLPAGDGCNYQTVASAELAVNVPGVGSVPVVVKIQRGFVGVDARVRGVPYRLVNTHLETRFEGYGEPGRYFQSAQAAELLQFMLVYLPPESGRRLLLVGDMNSDPRDETFPSVLPGYPPIVAVPPYKQFAELAGFTDIWTRRPGATIGKGWPLVGFTCCQAEDLRNRRSELYERVDLIFSLARPRFVLGARVLGESIADKTPPVWKGLWPSDHATVAATIIY